MAHEHDPNLEALKRIVLALCLALPPRTSLYDVADALDDVADELRDAAAEATR